MTETCPTCKGFIIAGTCKCAYNENHGIHTYRTILEIVEKKANIDTILFKVERLQQRLTDQEIQYLCDALEGDLDDANNLFIELNHMNEVVQ